jgi:integrase
MQQEHRSRDLAMLNLGIDSKLRGCDLIALKVRDTQHGGQIAPRAIVIQHKTGRPVQFEITPGTRAAVEIWIREVRLTSEDPLFPSRIHSSPHICTRQYARMLRGWVREVGLDWTAYGTHSMRRTKAALIYRKTKNLRAVRLLLGHSKLDYLLRRTMSRVMRRPEWPVRHFAEHSGPHHRPLRNASSRSSGWYRPGLPSGGVVLSRTACFRAMFASR